MSRSDEILAAIRAVLDGFAEELRGYRVVLFGSRATGRARERSDFDIGVSGPSPLPAAVFHRIADRLDEIPTLYRIDWVDLTAASPTFQREALKTTEVLH